MSIKEITPFSQDLQRKIEHLRKKISPLFLGRVRFDSPLLMAPLASITSVPWRLLMEDLGAGGTVSELISCHGINYKNEKTLKMLKIHPLEKNVGIQLFGEERESLSEAAKIAESFGAKFIDLNMGCPVRKVVGKGAGAALMQTPNELPKIFSSLKNAIKIPLSIKIRTGWDESHLNAKEIIHIASEEGIEFVAIHGRTKAQQYSGKANWDFIEQLAQYSPLPLIGNGDLFTPEVTKERLKKTKCKALMIARGALKNPFLFLESFLEDHEEIHFSSCDFLEVIKRLCDYTTQYEEREKTVLIQIKKHIVWFAASQKGSAQFRAKIFASHNHLDIMKMTEDFFNS